MDAKTRLQHIKSVAIRPKKNGQIRNLYNKDFDFLLEQAEKVERLEKQLSELVCAVYEHANEGTELMEIAERIDEME